MLYSRNEENCNDRKYGEHLMKILVINPNSDIRTNKRMEEKAKIFVAGEYEVDVVSLTGVPLLVGKHEDVAKGTNEMMEIVRNGKEYDGFVIACHSDPNLDLIKEITDKPVVGIAEASMKIASMYGNSFAVISPSIKSISKKKALARKYFCDQLFQTTRVAKSDDTEDIYEAAKSAVEEEHVDCIVLGCANYVNADKYIEEKLKVPVFDGLACALLMVTGLVKYTRYKKL